MRRDNQPGDSGLLSITIDKVRGNQLWIIQPHILEDNFDSGQKKTSKLTRSDSHEAELCAYSYKRPILVKLNLLS